MSSKHRKSRQRRSNSNHFSSFAMVFNQVLLPVHCKSINLSLWFVFNLKFHNWPLCLNAFVTSATFQSISYCKKKQFDFFQVAAARQNLVQMVGFLIRPSFIDDLNAKNSDPNVFCFCYFCCLRVEAITPNFKSNIVTSEGQIVLFNSFSAMSEWRWPVLADSSQ